MRLASKQFVRTAAILAVGPHPPALRRHRALCLAICAGHRLGTTHHPGHGEGPRHARVARRSLHFFGADLPSQLAAISSELDHVAAMTGDNPQQQANLADLRVALARAQDSSGQIRPADLTAASFSNG
jgi:hypothetical protein